MDELKLCPFCGGKASMRVYFKGRVGVECDYCGVRGLVKDTREEAIKMWNTRLQIPCEMCPQIDNPDSFIFHLLHYCPEYGTKIVD